MHIVHKIITVKLQSAWRHMKYKIGSEKRTIVTIKIQAVDPKHRRLIKFKSFIHVSCFYIICFSVTYQALEVNLYD